MSEEVKTNLTVATAEVEVRGVLSEKDLEEKIDADGKHSIRGNLVVQTDDTNFVTLNVWVNELTQRGDTNRAYAAMQTVMNEYHSIAEVGEAEATKVYCKRGTVEPNSYVGKEDLMVHTGVRYRANFLTRVKEDDFEPKAEIRVDGYINSIAEEVNRDGDMTGRLKVGLYVPTYRGVEPMEIIVPEDRRDEFENAFSTTQTIEVYADIVNRTVVDKKEIKLTVGGTRYKTETKSVRELVFNGGDGPFDDEKAYAPEAIAQALVERDLRLQKDKDDAAQAKKTGGNVRPGGAAPATGARPLPRFTSTFANM